MFNLSSATSPDMHSTYAVKIIRSSDEEIREVGLREFKLLQSLNHKNIIKMHEAF